MFFNCKTTSIFSDQKKSQFKSLWFYSSNDSEEDCELGAPTSKNILERRILKSKFSNRNIRTLKEKFKKRNAENNQSSPILFTWDEQPFLMEVSLQDPIDKERGFGYFVGDNDFKGKYILKILILLLSGTKINNWYQELLIFKFLIINLFLFIIVNFKL